MSIRRRLYCCILPDLNNVQDIYFTLTEQGGSDSYQKARSTLNKPFKPQANLPYERLCFHETGQLANETVEQFITRLRRKAQTCEFGDATTADEQIRDQVISKCSSHELSRKLLEKGRNMTMPQLREIARSMEESEKQARSIEGGSGEARSEVNSVSGKANYKGDASARKVKCFCCGYRGHKANDRRCPARGKQCRKCNGSGHFEAVCKTKEKQTSGRGAGGPRKPDVGKKGGAAHHVRQVETEGTQGDYCDYAFGILDDSNVSSGGEIPVKIAGLPVTMIIDSGASCHVIRRNVWEYLKENKAACVSTKASKKLYAYGSNQPLQVEGMFTVEVLHQVLQECDGAHNILDDVIVHTPTEEEHDKRFENVVRVLSSRGLTLNRDKCQFKMSHLEFMGHVLSARGIGPADVKVKAVVDASEPTNTAEVRSFLGLINFTARFIPDLVKVSAPFRQLTKSGEPFVWGRSNSNHLMS